MVFLQMRWREHCPEEGSCKKVPLTCERGHNYYRVITVVFSWKFWTNLLVYYGFRSCWTMCTWAVQDGEGGEAQQGLCCHPGDWTNLWNIFQNIMKSMVSVYCFTWLPHLRRISLILTFEGYKRPARGLGGETNPPAECRGGWQQQQCSSWFWTPEMVRHGLAT